MDVKIENGAVALNALRMPETVQGLEELLQRAHLRLLGRRGAFLYDRAFGSRLFSLTPSAAHAAEQALSMAREALLPCPEITATAAKIQDGAALISVETALGAGVLTVPLGKDVEYDGI